MGSYDQHVQHWSVVISVVLEARMTGETEGVSRFPGGWLDRGNCHHGWWIKLPEVRHFFGTFGLLLFWDFFLGREKKGQEWIVVNLDMLLEMTPYLEEVTLSPNRRATWKNTSWLVKRTISSLLPEILQKRCHLIISFWRFFLWSRSVSLGRNFSS